MTLFNSSSVILFKERFHLWLRSIIGGNEDRLTNVVAPGGTPPSFFSSSTKILLFLHLSLAIWGTLWYFHSPISWQWGLVLQTIAAFMYGWFYVSRPYDFKTMIEGLYRRPKTWQLPETRYLPYGAISRIERFLLIWSYVSDYDQAKAHYKELDTSILPVSNKPAPRIEHERF